LGPLPAALLTNSASLKGLTFLGALLSMDSTDKQIELTVKAGDHSALSKKVTIIQYGETNEAIGIDMFMSRNVFDEDDFG
jgi:hypothetical protein